MSVTDTRRVPYGTGESRNGGQTRRPEAVTDTRTVPYGTGPAPVTCSKCGEDIPADKNMLLRPKLNAPVRPTCIPCMNRLVADCRPYYCHHVPWEGPGVRDKRTRDEYQHWCDRCGRAFLGAMARRYCSPACGEATRNARRDRTRDRDARPCDTCGDLFTPPRADGRYCSNACRQKAYRRRRSTSGGAQ